MRFPEAERFHELLEKEAKFDSLSTRHARAIEALRGMEAAVSFYRERSHRVTGHVVISHDGHEHIEDHPCSICTARTAARAVIAEEEKG